jgi:hypothetical protein
MPTNPTTPATPKTTLDIDQMKRLAAQDDAKRRAAIENMMSWQQEALMRLPLAEQQRLLFDVQPEERDAALEAEKARYEARRKQVLETSPVIEGAFGGEPLPGITPKPLPGTTPEAPKK